MSGARQGTYKITNWVVYNNSLVRRRDIIHWFDEQVLAAWQHCNDVVTIGQPYSYSDLAVECLLVLRESFRLPYRQTEGLARSLLTFMEAAVSIPDYTLLAKRAANLNVVMKSRDVSGPIDQTPPCGRSAAWGDAGGKCPAAIIGAASRKRPCTG